MDEFKGINHKDMVNYRHIKKGELIGGLLFKHLAFQVCKIKLKISDVPSLIHLVRQPLFDV